MPPKAKAAADPKKKPKAKKTEKTEEDEANKVPQPDRDVFDAAVNKVNETIEGLQKKKAALTVQNSTRSAGKDEFFAQFNELKTKLGSLGEKIKELVAQKEGHKTEMATARNDKDQMKKSLGKMKEKIGFESEEQIDEEIAKIEFKLATTSMALKDEKALMKEIAELKKNRPKVSQVNNIKSQLDKHDDGKAAKVNIANINAEIGVYIDAKKIVQEEMTTLMAKRKDQMGNTNELQDEIKGIQKQIAEQVQERQRLRDEFNEAQKAFNEYKAQIRAKKAEEMMERRKEVESEYNNKRLKKKADELDQQPHVQEITLIEQTMKFCQSFLSSKSEEVAEEKKEIEHNLSDTKGKLEVMVKKEDREEFYYAPTKAKKSKNKSKGTKADATNKPIKHNAATFKLFDDLKLEAPITTDDIPELLEKLQAQLDEYKKKVEEWEKNREEKKKKILEGIEEDQPEETKEE